MSLFNIKLATTQSQVQTGKASQSIIAKYMIESRASNRSLVKRCESAWMIWIQSDPNSRWVIRVPPKIEHPNDGEQHDSAFEYDEREPSKGARQTEYEGRV